MGTSENLDKNAKFFVAGHRGLVGGAVSAALQAAGHTRIVTRSRSELDLTRATDVEAFFELERPEYVVMAAAKVGGIHANRTLPADFLTVNLQIQTNLFEASRRYGVKKLLFLGSSCIYPKLAPQPIKEEYLLTGPLEPTNEAYAIAKIAGILACRAYNKQHHTRFIAAMPTNLYGPGDNFDLESSHVLPAMIRKFHEAKVAGAPSVTLWGSGTPRREFLFVSDVAAACVHLMNEFEADGDQVFVNVGAGSDVTIRELAELVRDVVQYAGHIEWDISMPDGTPRKLMDSSRLRALGWSPNTDLRSGITETYTWYLAHGSPKSSR